MGTKFNPNQSTYYTLLSELRFHDKYITNTLGITSLGSYLNSIATSDVFGKLFNSPQEYIVSVRAYPFDLKLLNFGTVSNQNLYLGNEDTGVEMKKFDSIKPSLHLGNVDIKPKYGYSYLDYTPYTKITMWLPYIAFVELDPNEVMGYVLSIDYAIDLDSGEVTASISRIDTDKPYVLKTVNGKIGVDVPLGSTNAREIQKQLYSSTLGLVETAMILPFTKGFGTAMVGSQGIKATRDMFNTLQTHYTKGNGSLQGMNNFPLPQSVYIIYERNNLEYSPIETKGKPLMEQRELNEVHGYCEVAKFWEIMNFGSATKDEVDEIKNLLIGGVYLP